MFENDLPGEYFIRVRFVPKWHDEFNQCANSGVIGINGRYVECIFPQCPAAKCIAPNGLGVLHQLSLVVI